MAIKIIDDDILEKCIDKWGSDFQVELAAEELAELIEQLGKTLKYINQYKRGRIERDEVMEEFADVFLMMQQMRIIDSQKFDNICEYKVKRLKERLDG
jgi:hypothetical protein